MKKIVALLLAISISTGIPVSHIDAMVGKVINHYTESGIKYNALETTDGNLWITENNLKSGKYIIIFDNMGTDTIYDDEIVKLVKIK